MIFLGVAAFLLNVVIGRIVATEREQIGLLKAFGYGELGGRLATYVKFVLALVGAGRDPWDRPGGLAGAGDHAALYGVLPLPLPGMAAKARTCFAVAAPGVRSPRGCLGTWGSVRAAVRLAPAVAMVPAPPPQLSAAACWSGPA